MPINIYSVANDLESVGWQLISDSYKNLDTELEMKCPEGHIQKQTYREWRKHHICEACMAGDPYKIKKNKVPIKKIEIERVLALDAATNVSGYAIFDDGELVSYGTYKASGEDATERINDIKHWLAALIDYCQCDYCGIENIQLQSYGKGSYQVELYRALARLQGVVLDTLFEKKIPCGLAYASEWRKFCGINEGARERENKKKLAQDKVKLWYKQDCTQDEADAICIGKYFCGYLKNNRKKSSWGEQL